MTFHLGRTTFSCDHIGCFSVQQTANGFVSSEMAWKSIGVVAIVVVVLVALVALIRLGIKKIANRRTARG